MALPKKAQSQWCRFWFYAKEYTPPGEVCIPQYDPEPNVPRRLNVRSLPREQEEVVKGMRQAIQALKDNGLTAANINYGYIGEVSRTESDSEARDFVRLPRGAKRGATSSSQGAPRPPEGDEDEEATSHPEEGEPSRGEAEPQPKRLRPTILEGSIKLQRPLKDAIDAGARAGPGVKAIPTVKSKRKVLARPASIGADATRAAEARKAADLKKAAEAKKAPSDPMDTGSAREEPVAASKAGDASAGRVEPVVKIFPLASVGRGGAASATMGPGAAPPVVEEESADVGSTEAQGADVVAPEVEEDTAEEGGLSAPMKERRSKATRDRVRPPPSALTFTELHTALGEVHVAEVKRLTALVEEAAQKNRKLIALGTEFRAKQAEEERKKAKAEVADLTKVLEDKGRELEDVITEYKGKLEAATEARDAARGATAALREEVAALKLQHAKELAAEKEASEGIVLAV
nr:flagellar radial spoke protein 2-like [Lolium perenne]